MERDGMESSLSILYKSLATHKEYQSLSIAIGDKIVLSTDKNQINRIYENGLHVDEISSCLLREDMVFYSDFNYFDKEKQVVFNLIVDLNDEYLLSAENGVRAMIVTFVFYFILIMLAFLLFLYFLNIYPLIKLKNCIEKEECVPSSFFIKEHFFLYHSLMKKYNEITLLNKTLEEKVEDRTRLLSQTNTLFKEAQELTRIGNWEWNISDNSIVWSDEIFTIFGFEAQSFTPTYDAFMNSVHSDDRTFVKNALDKALESGEDYAIHHKIVLPDGAQKVVYEKGRVEYDKMGNPVRMVGTVQDITGRYEKSQELEFQSKMLNSVTDSIIVHNLDGNIIYVNEAACQTRGYTKDELLGMRMQDLDYHTEKNVDEIYKENLKNAKKQLEKNHKAVIEVMHKTKEGKVIPIEMTCKIVEEKEKSYIISIARDISALKAMNEKLQKLATTDNLTGIYNRHKFEEMFSIEVERVLRYKSPLTLIMLDIDHFKNVNDTYGHDVGDKVIKNIVDIVKKNIRNIDIFVRWGGEEFIILCPETDSLSAATLAQKLRSAIDDASFDKVGNITCSFGVASFKDNESKDSFIKRSDSALYKAKDEGRNRVVVF
jgi:diguanylate cyclase (GGDEF)-like protein/PAS domain S-box-containing protein